MPELNSKQTNITIPLSIFLDLVLGSEQHKVIPYEVGILLQALDKHNILYHIQFSTPEYPIERVILWNIQDWRTSIQKWKQDKERAQKDREEWDLLRRNVDLVSRKLAALTNQSQDDMRTIALKMVKEKAPGLIAMGIELLKE